MEVGRECSSYSSIRMFSVWFPRRNSFSSLNTISSCSSGSTLCSWLDSVGMLMYHGDGSSQTRTPCHLLTKQSWNFNNLRVRHILTQLFPSLSPWLRVRNSHWLKYEIYWANFPKRQENNEMWGVERLERNKKREKFREMVWMECCFRRQDRLSLRLSIHRLQKKQIEDFFHKSI